MEVQKQSEAGMKYDICECQKRLTDHVWKIHPDAEWVQGQYDWTIGMPYMIFSVQLNGKKKTKDVTVFLTYCPFCGRKLMKQEVE